MPMAMINLRRRAEEAEILDGPLEADADLAGNLRDLARINRWTGSAFLVQRGVRHLLERLSGASFSVLDVGGGGGDGVIRTVCWAERHHLAARGILLDSSAPILQVARARRHPGRVLLRGDACRLPLGDRCVDIVTCSLLLHHLSATQATTVLQEMARVARLGVVVDDLLRSHVGYWGALALGRLLTTNRLTRHDGPLSVRRAFRQHELATVMQRARLQLVWRGTVPGYRSVVAARAIDAAPL